MSAMKGQLLLVVLLVLAVLANGKPVRKREDRALHALNMALGASKRAFQPSLESKSVNPQDAASVLLMLKKEFEKGLELLKQLEKVSEPLDANFSLDPAFMSDETDYEKEAMEVGKLLAELPPFPKEDDLHFLGQCIKDAQKTDYNLISEPYQLLNKVIHQVIVCSISGLEVLIEAADVENIESPRLTKTVIKCRFRIIIEAGIEFLHLAKFMQDFTYRVITEGNRLTNNELVFGENYDDNSSDDDDNDDDDDDDDDDVWPKSTLPPGTNDNVMPRTTLPSGAGDDDGNNVDVDNPSPTTSTPDGDNGLERRVLKALMKRLNQRKENGLKMF